jgi:preprotein translocase subunit SecF
MSTPVEQQLAKRSLRSRLYHGETNANIVGRRRIWFTVSMVAVLLGLVSLLTRGLHLGIDFEGGAVWEVETEDVSVSEARDALGAVGLEDATIQTLRAQADGGEEQRYLRVESEPVGRERSAEVTAALAEVAGTPSDRVSLDSVGASWGREISEKAIRALLVFLVVVTLYIAVRFEMKMAIPTLVALIHDVLITVGVYSITQFEVTPATVIAMLTILGYSIYDGIVVFDKVDENTKLVSSTGGMTYGSMVNLSLNQALMRSLNTSITALLPVGSLLIVGSWIMGATPLQEFALALLVGLFSGAYSSIFIASPLLALLKEREPRYRDIKRRIEARAAAGAAGGRRARAAAATATEAKETGKAATGSAASKAKASRAAKQAASKASGSKATKATAPSAGEGEVGVDVDTAPLPSGGNGGGRPADAPLRSDRVIPPRPRKKSKGRRR